MQTTRTTETGASKMSKQAKIKSLSKKITSMEINRDALRHTETATYEEEAKRLTTIKGYNVYIEKTKQLRDDMEWDQHMAACNA